MWAAGRMQEVMKESVKLVNRTTQTLLLKELVRRKIPLKDVSSIEMKQRWNGRGKKDVQMIDFLMRRKLRSAVQEEKKQRRRYYEAKDRLFKEGRKLNRQSKVAYEFRKVQKSEVEEAYEDNLDKNRKKVKHLKEIKDREENNAERVATLFGVKVGDNELGEYEEKAANVWGKAEIGDEAKEVLNLGKKFRLHQRLDSIGTKTEIEKGLTIVRWKVKEKVDDGVEDEDDVHENEELMNVERKLVDMTLKKATEMKFNRRLYAPNAAPEKLESNLQQTREALEDVFEKYKKEKADDEGNIRESNLTPSQIKGLQELKEKTKDNLVVMPTDKTMGLSVETKESYKAAAEEHIKNDEKVSEKVRKHTEAEFNSIGKAMIRFLEVGGGRKHDDRIKEAMLTENVMLPPLSLYGKDHKINADADAEKGPVRRPVVSASEGPNARVSNLAAEVLNKAADAEKSEYECASTEALQSKVEELNRKLAKEPFANGGAIDDHDQAKVIAGSLDFRAWYPSLKKDVVIPTIRKRLEASPATINVNEVELARFLFVMMEEEDINAEGLKDVVHTMKNDEDKKPGITDQEMVGGEDFRTGLKSKLNPPRRKPTEAQRKRMVAIGMSLIVEKVMENFLYTFGGEDRRQMSGGPIGDVLTQAIARHVGNEFDDQFNLKLKSLDIKTELYQRYADDVDLIVRTVGKKLKFCPEAGSMIEKTALEIHDDEDVEEDEITMKEMKRIAEHIETEYDCPSLHPELDHKVPVLDLAVWIEEVEVAARGLDIQELHSCCCDADICLPLGEPRAAVQPSHPSLYTTPVYRGCTSGSQVHSLQPAAVSAPHPTTSCLPPGCHCPSRPCSSASAQSQSQLLAPRTSEDGGQGVGLFPPVTIDRPAVQPSVHQPDQVATKKVQQVQFEFFSKPMTAKRVMLATSAQPWGQKRTTLTQELIRRLLNCSKGLSCSRRRMHLDNFMQLLKNSGYSEKFRAEILNSGLKGYNKILKAERDGVRPIYRPKGWKESARWLEKRKKKSNWLGPFWKSSIFVPPTPGSELKKQMQAKEEEMRAGGREAYPIKIIETAGKTLEQTLVNTDPFNGNQCKDEKCEPNKNPKNLINCRRNGVTYRVSCLSCLRAGRPSDVTAFLECACYYGESAKNMHCRSKEHVSKFNSKSEKIRAESAFYKHLMNTHGGKSADKNFSDYFEIQILKAYKKPFTRLVEEGTFISSHRGELLNSKNEWHQAKLVRTTTRVIQGGADVLQQGGQGGGGQPLGGRVGGRAQGQ